MEAGRGGSVTQHAAALTQRPEPIKARRPRPARGSALCHRPRGTAGYPCAMELPWLGEHCSERSCKQLDFLPLKCDACGEVFCKDHIRYDDHKCSSAYKKNVQVPVCPLCNTPIPVQRGEIPDIVVGAHIDKDCKYNPAQQKQKIFTNKCTKPGCKRKEMMKVVCEQCGGSFCIKHRHPLDHDCRGGSQPISKAGYAALMRASHPTLKSPGAIGVPSNGNRQHNRCR